MPFARQHAIAGAIAVSSSRPNSPCSPACGFSPATAATAPLCASAVARTIASYAALPASADRTPGSNFTPEPAPYSTGSQTPRTRGSAAARRAISGPMPAGSPSVIATRGLAMAVAAAAVRAAAAAAAGGIVAAAFAAAAAVLDAFRVGQLVAQAALQPAAQAGQLRGIQAQVLLLRHLDRDRLERREKRRAAERPSARAVAANHLRFVPHADLPHLDARVELGRELAPELAENDAAFGGEIENEARAVERLLGLCELHAEPSP